MEEPMELSYFDLSFTDTVVLMLIWVFSEEIDILEFGHFQFNKYFGVFCNSHLPDMQLEKVGQFSEMLSQMRTWNGHIKKERSESKMTLF